MLEREFFMVYGYIRVSTDKQTVENQRFEIRHFCEKNQLIVERWIEETISGTKNPEKRRLGILLDGIQPDDLIICSELSRLGRSLFMIMSILSRCLSIGAKIWTIKDGYRLGDDIQSKVLAFAFGLSAEIERDLISQRTKEALARCRSEGKKLGRPFGKHMRLMLSDHAEEIQLMLAQGLSKAEIGRRLGTNRETVRFYVKRYLKQYLKHYRSRKKPKPDQNEPKKLDLSPPPQNSAPFTKPPQPNSEETPSTYIEDLGNSNEPNGPSGPDEFNKPGGPPGES